MILVVGSTGAGSSLVTDVTSLTFVAQSGADVPDPQSISVSKALGVAGSSLGFQILPSSTGNWLSVYPWSATTPATLSVTANSFGFLAGRYNGTVTLIPQAGNPRVVPVTLLVLGSVSAPNAIILDQTSITYNHKTGDIPAISVGVNTSPAPRDYTVATATAWLKLASPLHPIPASSLTDTSPGSFSVVMDATGLATGTYIGTIVVTSDGLPTQELPVTLNVGNGPPLNADPSSVILNDENTSAFVGLTTTGPTNFSFSTSVAPGAPWLQVSPAIGTSTSGASALDILAVLTGLTPGTYNGTVIVTLLSGGSGTLSIPVRLTVTNGSGTGSLVIQNSSVNLSSVIGGPNPSQTVDIGTSVSGSTHDFAVSATSTGGWLAVEPFRGTAPGTITVSANAAAVSGPGQYSGKVKITSLLTGEPQPIDVTFSLSQQAISADPPSLSFVQTEYAVAPSPQTLRINANLAGKFTITSLPTWAQVEPLAGYDSE